MFPAFLFYFLMACLFLGAITAGIILFSHLFHQRHSSGKRAAQRMAGIVEKDREECGTRAKM